MDLNSVFTVVRGAVLGDLIEAGGFLRSRVTTVGQALAGPTKQTVSSAIFGDDSLVAWPVGDDLVVIEQISDRGIVLWGPKLTEVLGRETVTATFSVNTGTFAWRVDTPEGTLRHMIVADGEVTLEQGTPLAEEAGLPVLDGPTLLELLRRRTGITLQPAETAIPIDLSALASEMVTYTPDGEPVPEPTATLEMFTVDDGFTQDVVDDFNALSLGGVMTIAQILDEVGSCCPFALTISPEGEKDGPFFIDAMGAFTEIPDQGVDTSRQALVDLLRPSQEKYRAIGLVGLVQAGEGKKAHRGLRVCVEHRDGSSAQVIAPIVTKGVLKKRQELADTWFPQEWPGLLWS
ncbi:MAG: hypothetical protein FWG15_01835 [Propionibacteriaceae bacterium]|nr:hypothetical protein [Propionibacteriaceae bacterium]